MISPAKIILYLLVMAACPALALSDSFVPPAGKTLLLVGQDRNTIIWYVGVTGNIPGGTMLYTSIQKMDGLENAVDYGSGPMDGKTLLAFYPDSVIQIGLYMVGALYAVVDGTYDENLLFLAQWIKKADRPVYLRIGYEFDNPSNRYYPEKYKEVFRYVVDFLRKQGVTNVAYVWHSECANDHPDEPWMDWYPGDDYVDWFGVSLYATQQIPMALDFLKLAREHHKPFMIAESAPWGIYTVRGKADWFEHVFDFIKEQNIEAFCYIDSNWDVMPMYQGRHIGDSRIEASPEIRDIWLKEIGQDRYLKSSEDLFQSLGWTHST